MPGEPRTAIGARFFVDVEGYSIRPVNDDADPAALGPPGVAFDEVESFLTAFIQAHASR